MPRLKQADLFAKREKRARQLKLNPEAFRASEAERMRRYRLEKKRQQAFRLKNKPINLEDIF